MEFTVSGIFWSQVTEDNDGSLCKSLEKLSTSILTINI